MNYLSVAETAKKWCLSERSVRNYCAGGRVAGAYLDGKTWRIPEDAAKPGRLMSESALTAALTETLKREKDSRLSGGIYHRVQIDFAYNSNHIEGSRLTHDQTRYIYETNTIGNTDQAVKVDDIIETVNHFRCVDMIIDNAGRRLTEKFILKLHSALKTGTADAAKDWFAVGAYKKLPNEVGGRYTTAPEKVSEEMGQLLEQYNSVPDKTLDDILDFHVRFERIHPFQDGNGRVGRLILFKECLKNRTVPFIITDEMKFYYYRGLARWNSERGYLTDTCLTAQDQFKLWMEYFKIS